VRGARRRRRWALALQWALLAMPTSPTAAPVTSYPWLRFPSRGERESRSSRGSRSSRDSNTSTDSLLEPIEEGRPLPPLSLQQPHIVLPAGVLLDIKRTPPPADIIFEKRRRSREDKKRVAFEHDRRMAWRRCKQAGVAGVCMGVCLALLVLRLRQIPPLPISGPSTPPVVAPADAVWPSGVLAHSSGSWPAAAWHSTTRLWDVGTAWLFRTPPPTALPAPPQPPRLYVGVGEQRASSPPRRSL